MEELELEKTKELKSVPRSSHQPTGSYILATWLALFAGIGAYLIGLYNATMELNEKGYYFTVLMFGLYAAISLQKAVRDRLEGIKTTNLYYGICWIGLIISISLMSIGLYNAGSIIRSEKGFYAMAFVLALFSAVTIQKNVRDLEAEKESGH